MDLLRSRFGVVLALVSACTGQAWACFCGWLAPDQLQSWSV